MRNIKLTIEYEGSNYAGWQRQGEPRECQSNKATIQQAIEEALAQLLQEKIRLIGSGRTDAGVHALGQVANFKTNSRLKCENIFRGLNALLPEDIRIKRTEDVDSDFHAQFSAKSKVYLYCVANNSFAPPLKRHYCYFVKAPLSLKRMRQAAKLFLGQRNFRSFQAANSKTRNPIRTIQGLKICRNKDMITFEIKGSGFLYRMVRNIVGTLLEVGRGKIGPEDVQRIIAAQDRACAGPCAPAKGLVLDKVNFKG